MKGQLKKLKGTTLKTLTGDLSLREYYRLDDSQYDQIYFKCSSSVDPTATPICKLYELSEQPSRERFHNEMQQYEEHTLGMLYDRVHCQEVKIKKGCYGIVVLGKLEAGGVLRDCMGMLSGFERMRLTISLVQLLIELKDTNRIYCNIRPSNIYKTPDGFTLINPQYLRPSGTRTNMDTFMLQTLQNNWQYWPSQVVDPYSTQVFDYAIDVYAVGCVLYELVSGRYPFESKLAASSGLFGRLEGKNLVGRVAEAFLGTAGQRRQINLKQILAKLKQSSNELKMPSSPTQLLTHLQPQQQKNRKGSSNGGGIFDNISNVFSKMMNDSQGWFLNYVEDNEEAPNQKYLDNILTKMYKKEEKSEKISMIIQKFVSNNQGKINSIKKTILMIGQAIRRGPETALHSFLPNILSIKSIFSTTKQIQTLCTLLQKKHQLNEKLKKIMTGNFHIIDLSTFKQLSIQDLANMLTYIQKLIQFVESRSHSDNSELLQSWVNFACDEVYDLVSTVIFAMLAIRKDNQLQLRNDHVRELQPLEKVMNMCLKKLSNLSNFISAHAIYSLQNEYIPYQQQIMLKTNPYYTTMQYFYNSCRNYKGLSVPTDYAALFSSTFHRDEKKTVHSASKEMKSSAIQIGGHGKNYFKEEVNSDQDDQFNRSGRIVMEVSSKKIEIVPVQVSNSNNNNKKSIIKQEVSLNVKVNDVKVTYKPPKNTTSEIDRKDSQGNAKKNTNINIKVENTISFEQFGDITKLKQAPKSPAKDFKDFEFFNQYKKPDLKKPPLPIKNTKIVTVNVTNTSFVDFDQIFDKTNNSKNSASSSDLKSGKAVQPNFDAFSSFLVQPHKKPQPENPLVKKLLEGLKLKQLKDLIQKNKAFVLDFKQLKLIKVIGSGSAGEVYYGKYKQQQVAIKKVKAKENPNALKQFQRQLVTYIKIKKNPHLVSLVGVSADGGDFYLIAEFCSSGSLFDLLHKKKLDIILSWKQRLNFAIEIAEGMQFLHSMKPIIIHRDLKSLNVFVTKTANNWKMKVADFGLSRSPQADMMTTQLGTIHWMAPQLLEGKQYSYKVDVYSYGVLLWEILSRTTPYSNLQNPMAILKYVVIDKKRPNMESIPKQCPASLINVMEKCWAHDPNDRPPFSQIIKLLKTITI